MEQLFVQAEKFFFVFSCVCFIKAKTVLLLVSIARSYSKFRHDERRHDEDRVGNCFRNSIMFARLCGEVRSVQCAGTTGGTDWGTSWHCHKYHEKALVAEIQRWTGYILSRGSGSWCSSARVPERSQPQTQASSIVSAGSKTLNY